MPYSTPIILIDLYIKKANMPVCPESMHRARDNIEEVTYSFATNVTLFTNQVMEWLRWGTGNEPPRSSVNILLQHVISEENPKASVIREVDYIYHELLHQVTGLLIVEENK